MDVCLPTIMSPKDDAPGWPRPPMTMIASLRAYDDVINSWVALGKITVPFFALRSFKMFFLTEFGKIAFSATPG